MKEVEIVFLVVLSSFHLKAVSSKLEDILIAVKTSKRSQNTTLPPIINTWYEIANHQTWFFTDYNNPIHQLMTNFVVVLIFSQVISKSQKRKPNEDHMVVTKCPVDNERSPCCQMSAAIKLYMQTNYKWFCYFEDETYVNVPRLVTELENYDYQEDWYIGQKYARRRTQYKGYGQAFWYAASGAGWCMSRPLAKKVQSFMSNFGFVSTCLRFGQPGDMTLGFIVGGLLGLNLTIVPRFHSNDEHISQIPLERLGHQISLSYGSDGQHVIKVPGLPLEKDPTRFVSLHCFLFPCAKRCENHPFRRKCHCHHNNKPTLKAEETSDSSKELQDLTVNLYYQEKPPAQKNDDSMKERRQSDAIETSYRNERPRQIEQEDVGRAKEWQRSDPMDISYDERPRTIEKEDHGSNQDWRRSAPKLISYHNERLEQISQDNGELTRAWQPSEPSVNPKNGNIKKMSRDNVSSNKEWWWTVSKTNPTPEEDYEDKPEKNEKKGRLQEYYRSANKWQLVNPTLNQNQNEEPRPSVEKPFGVTKKWQKFDSSVKTNHTEGLGPKTKKSSGLTKKWVWVESTVEPDSGVDEFIDTTPEWGNVISLVEYDYEDKPEKNKKTKRSRPKKPKTFRLTKKWQRIDPTVNPYREGGPNNEENSYLTTEWDGADSTIEPKWGWTSSTVNSDLEDDYEDKPQKYKELKRSRMREPKTFRSNKKWKRIDSAVNLSDNEGSRVAIKETSGPTTEWDWTDATINPDLEIDDGPKGVKNKKRKSSKLRSSDLTVNLNHNERSRPRIEENSGRTREWWWYKPTIKPDPENEYLDGSKNKKIIEYNAKRKFKRTTVIAQIYLLPVT